MEIEEIMEITLYEQSLDFPALCLEAVHGITGDVTKRIKYWKQQATEQMWNEGQGWNESIQPHCWALMFADSYSPVLEG